MDVPVLPAPLARQMELLDECNADLPGQLKLDEQGRLLKTYLKYDGFAKPLIEAFDRWIIDILPKQINAFPIRLPSGEVISFDRITLEPPFLLVQGRKIIPDYPALALEAGRTYAAKVYVDIVSQTRRVEKVALCEIPVMVGSTLDNIRNKSDREKLELRIDPSDPGGWFVIKNSEKIVLINEKMREMMPILHMNTDKMVPLCKMTCTTLTGSKVVTLMTGRKHKTIKLHLQFLGEGKTMPLFSVFRLLGVTEPEEMKAMVGQFLNPNAQIRGNLAMEASLSKVQSIGNDIQYLIEKKGGISGVDIRTRLLEDLFPHIPVDQPRQKLELLSIMAARLVEYLAGTRKFDDRDSWGRKRLSTAARALQQLFMGLWNKLHDELRKDIEALKIKNFDSVVSFLQRNTITSEIVSSFSANNWGVSHNKENITDILNRQSLLATYAHLLRINTPASRKAKIASLRLVQPSALGYVCPSNTPEGEQCGLVKNLAITAYISIDQSDTILRREIAPFLSPVRTEQHINKCMLNGYFLGWIAGMEARDHCLMLRRMRRGIPKDTCIKLDNDGFLYIYTDGGRPTRPLLIIDPDGTPVIEKKKLFGAPFETLMSEGCVEYIDAFEQESIMLAQTLSDIPTRKEELKKALEYLQQVQEAGEDEDVIARAQEALVEIQNRRPFTHCELDPQAILSVAASIMPMPEHNQAPRVTYQCSMGQQALGTYHSNYQVRTDTSAKILAFPSRPLFEPQLNQLIGLDTAPAGMTVTLAIMPYRGFNQEDAIVMNRGSIERGLFTVVKLKTYTSVERSAADYREQFSRPKPGPGEKSDKYAHIAENGMPMIGTYLQAGDCVIGKIHIDANSGTITNASTYLGVGEEGTVDRVFLSHNAESEPVMKVKLRRVRPPQEGDKFASRYAQKGTIGLIEDQNNLPFSEKTGTTPDIIINPTCIPSRMTISKMIEVVASKHASLTGERYNASAFRPFDIQLFRENLRAYGYHPLGNERFINGMTGEPIIGQIFTGPCYYQALRHHVIDKYQMRRVGAIDPETGQPIGGRSRGGGQRAGEMEKDAFISHGAAKVLEDRLCYSSDVYTTVWCRNCGTIAISNVVSKEFICRKCGVKGDFGTASIPYAFKLLIQMLNGAGIQINADLREI